MEFWSLSVKAVMVQKHSALCVKRESPFSLCVSACVWRCFSCSLRTACNVSVFCLSTSDLDKQAAMSKGSVSSESVERNKKEGEVAERNMVRGRENNARGKILIINGSLQSGRLMLEDVIV